MTLEIPPDDDSDEASLQLVECTLCGFGGVAVYRESRRGAGDSWHHSGYRVDEALLPYLRQTIEQCPERRTRTCRCPSHITLGDWGSLHRMGIGRGTFFQIRHETPSARISVPRMIEEGVRFRAYELDLRARGLVALPPGIGCLGDLRVLDLADNQLCRLAPEVGQLGNLRELFLNRNRLTSLPPEICRLPGLEILNLDDNLLASLPTGMPQLTHLSRLQLRRNPLTALPADIGAYATPILLHLLRQGLFQPTREWRDAILVVASFPPPGGMGAPVLRASDYRLAEHEGLAVYCRWDEIQPIVEEAGQRGPDVTGVELPAPAAVPARALVAARARLERGRKMDPSTRGGAWVDFWETRTDRLYFARPL